MVSPASAAAAQDRHLRGAGKQEYFSGEGDLITVRPGNHMWETNFVPDLGSIELKSWGDRGAGGTNIMFVLADGTMHAHISEMPVGTYKKGHRHGPGLHVLFVHGSGYTLLWYYGDKDYKRIEWKHGVVFAPPDEMFHQHFDTSQRPARYLALGFGLMLVYALSVAGYLAFVLYGYRAVQGRVLILGWTFIAAIATGMLGVWITVINFLYLLLQIAMAVEAVGVAQGARAVARFIRAEVREIAGVFLVVVALVVAATLASALAWSGVGLIAFVPLVGLAVFPLQLAALLVRGLAFEYLGLTALGAYLTLYQGHASQRAAALDGARIATPLGHTA